MQLPFVQLEPRFGSPYEMPALPNKRAVFPIAFGAIRLNEPVKGPELVMEAERS